MSDPSLALIAFALIVSAPLAGGYGAYAIMKAIASKNYMLGLFGTFMALLSGIGIGKLIWGGVLW